METQLASAADIMTCELNVCRSTDHVISSIERLISHGVSGMPVIDDRGNLAGRFSETSAVAALNLARSVDDVRGGGPEGLRLLVANDVMSPVRHVIAPDEDVCKAVDTLLMNRLSVAPVVDDAGRLLGVFSERSAMGMFIGMCWEQMPSSCVSGWLDTDAQRCLEPGTTLIEILRRFRTTRFRRLFVIEDGVVVGQLSRRDALKAVLEVNRSPLKASLLLQSRTPGELATHTGDWMETGLATAGPDVDVLTVCQLFVHGGARQLPVVSPGKSNGFRLLGQISRSDLLRAVSHFFPESAQPASTGVPLYLSSVNRRDVSSVMG